jgi:hypothetical protein
MALLMSSVTGEQLVAPGEMRFDVPRVVKDIRNEVGMEMEMPSGPPSVAKTRLTFSDKARTRSSSLAFETHVASLIFPWLPKEYNKIRFVSRMLSLVAVPKESAITMHFSIPEHDLVPLGELATVSEILVLYGNSVEGGVEISYERGGYPIAIGYRTAPMDLPAAVREMADATQHAAFVARYFGLPETLNVYPDELHRFRSNFASMRGVLDRTVGSVGVGVVTDADSSIAGRTVAIVHAPYTRLGDDVLALCAVHSGPAAWKDGAVWVNDGRVEVLGKWIVPVKKWKRPGHLQRVREAAERSLSGLQDTLVIVPQ